MIVYGETLRSPKTRQTPTANDSRFQKCALCSCLKTPFLPSLSISLYPQGSVRSLSQSHSSGSPVLKLAIAWRDPNSIISDDYFHGRF